MKEFRGHSFHQTEMGTPAEMQFFLPHTKLYRCALLQQKENHFRWVFRLSRLCLSEFWDSDILRCWRYEKRPFTVCAVVNSHFLCEIACKELRFSGLLSQFSLMPLGFHRLLVMLGGGMLGIPANKFLCIKIFKIF